MSTVISRSVDVSNSIVGYFKDLRLFKTGALLYKKIVEHQSPTIKKVAENRAEEIAFDRFLQNSHVTDREIKKTLSDKTAINCGGIEHVLCIQDTMEVNYPRQATKKEKFGINREASNTHGLLAHVGLMVNASNADILGIIDTKIWTRQIDGSKDRSKLSIENKESYKWLGIAEQAKTRLQNKNQCLTIIGDRESDIYELFDRIPDNNVHVLVRLKHNRKLCSNETIYEHIHKTASAGSYTIRLPKITGVRKECLAQIEVKYSTITIREPRNSYSNNSKKEIVLNCVEAKEIGRDRDDKIHWLILTTHEAENLEFAKKIITWYTQRWYIECSYRDEKDLYFGMGLKKARIEIIARRQRLLLISAIVIIFLTLLGAASEAAGFDRYLKANTVKTRTHSLFSQRRLVFKLAANLANEWKMKIAALFIEYCQGLKSISTDVFVV